MMTTRQEIYHPPHGKTQVASLAWMEQHPRDGGFHAELVLWDGDCECAFHPMDKDVPGPHWHACERHA